MLVVNLSVWGLRVVVAKVVDCLDLKVVRIVGNVGLRICERCSLAKEPWSSFRGICAQGLLTSNVI